MDTRKTTPGWRLLEKYAVRLGGGRNHRLGLFDGVLIKNNHLTAVGSIDAAVRQAKARAHHLLKIEVEVTDLDGAGRGPERRRRPHPAGQHGRRHPETGRGTDRGRALLEASGSMTKDRLPKVAATGVNLISMGALTHSAPAVDIHLRLIKDWR